MAAEKSILCIHFEEFFKPDEIGLNMCLTLQNTLGSILRTAFLIQQGRAGGSHIEA